MITDAQLISFLAGVPIGSIPAPVPLNQRARILTSAPDTLRRKNGIAAVYPAENTLAREILAALKLLVFPIQREADIHAFTALGTCLPAAIMYWERMGRQVTEAELLETAAKFDLPDYTGVLAWVRTIQPRHLTPEEQDRYITRGATPGGVTEAILAALESGAGLSTALARGVERSRELGNG
jgi:pyrroline-5-carboxylate reductase